MGKNKVAAAAAIQEAEKSGNQEEEDAAGVEAAFESFDEDLECAKLFIEMFQPAGHMPIAVCPDFEL
jgi:hypothetical protein